MVVCCVGVDDAWELMEGWFYACIARMQTYHMDVLLLVLLGGLADREAAAEPPLPKSHRCVAQSGLRCCLQPQYHSIVALGMI